MQDPGQVIVSYAQRSDLDIVMIAGRIVKENGMLEFNGLEKRGE